MSLSTQNRCVRRLQIKICLLSMQNKTIKQISITINHRNTSINSCIGRLSYPVGYRIIRSSINTAAIKAGQVDDAAKQPTSFESFR